MAVNRGDIPHLLLAGMQEEFMQGYKTPMPDIYKQCCMTVKSTKAVEPYAWLGSTPKMRQWVAERHPKGMFEHNYSLTNKDFEATIEIDRNAIDDDQYGQIRLRSSQLGFEVHRYYDEYFATIVKNGTSTLCYDGQDFFSQSHQENLSPTQSNAPTAGSTYALSSATAIISVFQLVYAAMAEFMDDENKLAGIKVTHVMVPPALVWLFRVVFDKAFIGGGEVSATQTYKGAVEVIENPFLPITATAANSPVYWMDLSKPVKPFIFQDRKAPQLVALDKPTDYEVFMRRKIYYGVDARWEMGYGDWRMCYVTVGA